MLIKLLVLLITFATLTPPVPQPPHVTYGSYPAKYKKITIEAFCNGRYVATAETLLDEHLYLVETPAYPYPEYGCVSGEIITFTLNGKLAAQADVWEWGTVTNLDLSVLHGKQKTPTLPVSASTPAIIWQK